jgi:hypothetical protein
MPCIVACQNAPCAVANLSLYTTLLLSAAVMQHHTIMSIDGARLQSQQQAGHLLQFHYTSKVRVVHPRHESGSP